MKRRAWKRRVEQGRGGLSREERRAGKRRVGQGRGTVAQMRRLPEVDRRIVRLRSVPSVMDAFHYERVIKETTAAVAEAEAADGHTRREMGPSLATG